MDTLLALAVLPAARLLFYVYKLDPVEKEPPKLLASLLALGVISVIPAVLLEMLFDYLVLENWSVSLSSYLIVENFLGVALIEELCKFFFLSIRTWGSREFDYVFDGIVYAVFVSLGFAIAENIMYVFEYGFATGVMRAFTAIPGHCVFAVFMGFFYGEAKLAQAQGNGGLMAGYFALAIVVPVLCHGLYDLLASIDGPLALLAFFAVLVLMVVVGLRVLKVASKEQKRIQGQQPLQQQPLQQQPYQQPYQQQWGQPSQQQQWEQPLQQQWEQPLQQQWGQPGQQQWQQPYQQRPYQQQPYQQQPYQQQWGQPSQQPYQQQRPQAPQDENWQQR